VGEHFIQKNMRKSLFKHLRCVAPKVPELEANCQEN
jgi:hypothetical protein